MPAQSKRGFQNGGGADRLRWTWLRPKLGGCWGPAGSGGCVCLCPPAQLGLSVGTPLGKPCRPPGSMGGRSWWQRRSWKERREPHRGPRVQTAALPKAAPRVKGRGAGEHVHLCQQQTAQGGAPHLPELAPSRRLPLPLGKDQGCSSERPFGESPLRWTAGTLAGVWAAISPQVSRTQAAGASGSRGRHSSFFLCPRASPALSRFSLKQPVKVGLPLAQPRLVTGSEQERGLKKVKEGPGGCGPSGPPLLAPKTGLSQWQHLRRIT